MIRLTAAEKAAWKRKGIVGDRQRGHKFNAVRTTVDSITFASKAEAKRYGELKMLEKAGEICDIELQPEYPLFVKPLNGPMVAIGLYRADFRYKRRLWTASVKPRIFEPHAICVEDVKGMRTPLYIWKKKHVEAQYGITITEITR